MKQGDKGCEYWTNKTIEALNEKNMIERKLIERCLKCHLKDHCGAWQHILDCGQCTP